MVPGLEPDRGGSAAGLRVAAEAFADRGYLPDGTLAARATPGAVITDQAIVVARAVRMVTEGVVESLDGTLIPIAADTLCLHGDTPGAGRLAAGLRDGLTKAGVTVQALLAD